jgi:hypothetical protein
MIRSLCASAVQGEFRWPLETQLKLNDRSDSQTDIGVLETTVDPAIAA